MTCGCSMSVVVVGGPSSRCSRVASSSLPCSPTRSPTCASAWGSPSSRLAPPSTRAPTSATGSPPWRPFPPRWRSPQPRAHVCHLRAHALRRVRPALPPGGRLFLDNLPLSLEQGHFAFSVVSLKLTDNPLRTDLWQHFISTFATSAMGSSSSTVTTSTPRASPRPTMTAGASASP